MPKSIRVGIADDDEVMRLMLTRVLSTSPGLEIVAAVPDGTAAVALAQTGHIDVLILDLEMPGMNGTEALRLITVLAPAFRVLMHSSRRATEYGARMLKEVPLGTSRNRVTRGGWWTPSRMPA